MSDGRIDVAVMSQRKSQAVGTVSGSEHKAGVNESVGLHVERWKF